MLMEAVVQSPPLSPPLPVVSEDEVPPPVPLEYAEPGASL
jgi:hypothetical protein